MIVSNCCSVFWSLVMDSVFCLFLLAKGNKYLNFDSNFEISFLYNF